MDDETFACIVPPAATIQQCFDRLLNEAPPSLDDGEGTEGKTWSMLIDRREFVEDTLQSFEVLEARRKETMRNASGQAYAAPSCGVVPTVVEPSGKGLPYAVSSFFGEGKWEHVWSQFERDVARETLIVNGLVCRDAEAAFEKISDLMNDAYDELLAQNSNEETNSPARVPGWKGRGILRTARSFVELVKETVKKPAKERKVKESVRLAVLGAQQTILALPLELLTAHFSKSEEDVGKDDDYVPQMVHIGEMSYDPRDEGVKRYSENSPGRMFVQVERRSQGSRLPFVRVDKQLRVFTTDEAMVRREKLYLRIIVEINLLSDDQVELSWEWGRP